MGKNGKLPHMNNKIKQENKENLYKILKYRYMWLIIVNLKVGLWGLSNQDIKVVLRNCCFRKGI